MKHSLQHLPPNKQQEILEIADIIKEAAKPEMIILFGSYAKGTYVEHRYTANDGTTYEYISDYDFLVVTEKNTIKEYELEDIVNSRTKRTRPDINIQLHEIAYVNEGLEFGQYFFTDIVKEGIVLYNSNKLQLAESRELSKYEQKEVAQRYFDIWFANGNEFLIDAQNAFNRRSFKKSAFELHQATESFLSTVLLVFTGYKPKTHNLLKLRKHTKNISEELFMIFSIESNSKDKFLFDLLKKGYIDARYKATYEVEESEVDELIKKVSQTKNIVYRICQVYLSSFS